MKKINDQIVTFNIKHKFTKKALDELISKGCKLKGKGKTHWELNTKDINIIPNEARIMVSPQFLKENFKKSWIAEHRYFHVHGYDEDRGIWYKELWRRLKSPLWISGKQLKKFLKNKEQ